jgi:hypothetical protein
MTGNSLDMQWPLTSQSYDSVFLHHFLSIANVIQNWNYFSQLFQNIEIIFRNFCRTTRRLWFAPNASTPSTPTSGWSRCWSNIPEKRRQVNIEHAQAWRPRNRKLIFGMLSSFFAKTNSYKVIKISCLWNDLSILSRNCQQFIFCEYYLQNTLTIDHLKD